MGQGRGKSQSSEGVERTLALLKPDATARNIVGEVLRRIEGAGLAIAAIKMLRMSRRQAEALYDVHRGKPFYGRLVGQSVAGPVVAVVLEGKDAVNTLRNLVGATNPAEAKPGTIRADFGLNITENVIHASDSRGAAEREIRLFFSTNEIFPPPK